MSLTTIEVTDYIRDELGIDTSAVDASTLLFTSGLVDSFSLVSLVTFIERAGGIRVEPEDVTLANLDTIQRIVDFATCRTDA